LAGARDSDGGGAAGALGSALRSEGVLSGKGLRAVLSGRGVRVPSGSGLRTFGGGVGAAGAAAAGIAPVMVPLERVDEGLGVIEDLGPGDGREEGEALLVEVDFARRCDAVGFGGKLSISRTLSVSVLNLTIKVFRFLVGRSSELRPCSGAGRLGGFIVPNTIFVVGGGGGGVCVGKAVGFAATVFATAFATIGFATIIADADAAAAAAAAAEPLENESLTTGGVGLGGGTKYGESLVRSLSPFFRWTTPFQKVSKVHVRV
jgi:hypothetical protein